jgi:hypothetical protein
MQGVEPCESMFVNLSLHILYSTFRSANLPRQLFGIQVEDYDQILGSKLPSLAYPFSLGIPLKTDG